MAWVVLFVAGLLEIVWAVAMRSGDELGRPLAAAITAGALLASLALLNQALREIPLGTAYAVWVGIGAAGTAIVGVLWLGEPATPARLASLFLIVAGVMGLKSSGPARAADVDPVTSERRAERPRD